MKSLSTMSTLNTMTAKSAAVNSCAASSQAIVRRAGRLSSPSKLTLALIDGDRSFQFADFCANNVANEQVLKNVVMGGTQNPVGISTNAGKYHTEIEWSKVGRVGQHKGRLQ